VDLPLPAVTQGVAKLEAAKGISAFRTDFTKVRISVRKGSHPQLVGPLRDWQGDMTIRELLVRGTIQRCCPSISWPWNWMPG